MTRDELIAAITALLDRCDEHGLDFDEALSEARYNAGCMPPKPPRKGGKRND